MRHTVANMGLCLALALSGAGCATAPLDQARRNFQAGNLAQADTNLAAIPQNKDAILYLMERGMVRHLRHDYTGSTRDWLYAAQLEEKLETHSLTKAGASMVVQASSSPRRTHPLGLMKFFIEIIQSRFLVAYYPAFHHEDHHFANVHGMVADAF